MAIYYIDFTTGDDGDTGLSEALAWKTVAKVNAATPAAGDSVLFKRGETWRGEKLIIPASGTAGNIITFGAYGTGADPIFQYSVAKNDTGDWTEESANVWYAGTVTEDVGHIATTSTSAPTILAAKKSTKAGCTTQGDFFYDAGADRLYIYSTSNPATAYSGFMELAIGSDTGGCVIGGTQDYVTIDGLAVKYAGAHGMQFSNCDNLIIQNCDVSYIGGVYLSGTERYGNGIEIWDDGTNITIQDNTVSQAFDEGVTSQSDGNNTRTNQIFRRNTISKCGRGFAFSTSGGTPTVSGIYIDDNAFTDCGLGWATPAISNGQGLAIKMNCPQCTEGYVRGNTIITTATGADPIGRGIYQGGGVWEISGNWIQDTDNGAIRVDSVGGGFTSNIYYNVIINTNGHPGIWLIGPGTTHADVYNNTLYLALVNQGIKIGTNGGYEVDDVVVKNNIIHMTDDDDWAIYVSDDSTNVTLDYNCYYGTHADRSIYWKGTSYKIATAWAAYKAASGQDAHSIVADPLFVNAAAGDFHLQAPVNGVGGSPCINIGAGVGLTTDYEGNPIR